MSMAGPNPRNLVPYVVDPEANLTIRPEEGEGFETTTKLPTPLVHFFKGEPEALGATQIFAGVVILVFGAVLLSVAEPPNLSLLAPVVFSGLPFWSSIVYITSGSLSVAASAQPTMGKVKASLVLNIISTLAAVVGIIMILITLLISPYMDDFQQHCVFQPNELCKGEFHSKAVLQGLISILLVFTVLVFCITIASSVFGCKTTCRTAFTEVNLVLYQTTSGTVPDTEAEALRLSTAPLASTNPIIIHGSSTEPQDN